MHVSANAHVQILFFSIRGFPALALSHYPLIHMCVHSTSKFHHSLTPLQAIEETIALEQQDDLVHNGADVLLCQIDDQRRLRRFLIRVVNAGETLDLAGARRGVDTTNVVALAVLQRRRNVNQEAGAGLLDHLAGLLTGLLEGRNGRGDDSSTSLGQLRGNEGDTGDVDIAVLAAEAEL